jgi:DNA-binding ferritin-like protein (Dps family)
MTYHNKEYLKGVIHEYKKLPYIDMLNQKLYDDMRELFNESDCTNGEVMNTMKLMIIQMCEKMMEETTQSFTEEVQEKYK